MNEYRIYLVDRNGNKQHDHTSAVSAQDAADRIREDLEGMLYPQNQPCGRRLAVRRG